MYPRDAASPFDWLEKDPAALRRVLGDRHASPDDRMAAIELAGDLSITEEDLVDGLISILTNTGEPEELRAAAAISLGPVLETCYEESFDADPYDDEVLIPQATYDRIRHTMRDLYRDATVPVLLRRRVLEASVRSPEEWHEGAVRAAWYDADPAWKLTSIFCMSFVGEFDDEITEALENADPLIRLEAVRAAGANETAAAWPHVVRIIREERSDRALLLAAIDAVGLLRPDDADDVLSELSTLDDDEISRAVVDTLLLYAPDSWEEDDFDLD